jgi:hypothetical protein
MSSYTHLLQVMVVYIIAISSIFPLLSPELASKVFGFNLELKFKPGELNKVPLDKRIAATVTTILKAFLHEKENAVVYICDNNDNREKARFHKFTNWFKMYNDGSIVQLKGVIRAGNTNILNALS